MMIEIFNILDARHYLENIDVVIFDLDDTLYSEKTYVRSGYRFVAKIFPEIHDMEQKLWSAFLNHEKAFDSVLQKEGYLTEGHLKKCVDEYRNHDPDIRLYEGVRDLLITLRHDGKKLGMITDGRPEGQRQKIKSLQLEQLFDYIIITDELGGEDFRKPNPKSFSVMRDFFQTEYHKMVYIGDNCKKDFQAPIALGMESIWFHNPDGIYSGESQKKDRI